MTKFYVNNQGRYLGGYDGAEPPDGAIEVGAAPDHAADIWNGSAWVAAPVVPEQVTMRQARLALLDAGLLSNVDTAINALPSPDKEAARIEWDYSSAVERHRGLVQTLGTALGLSSAQLDDLFIAASTL